MLVDRQWGTSDVVSIGENDVTIKKSYPITIDKALNVSATFNDVTNNKGNVNYRGVINAAVISYANESVTLLLDNTGIDTTRKGLVLVVIIGK